MESLVQDSSAPPPSARLQHNRRSGTHGCALLLRGGDVCHILGGHRREVHTASPSSRDSFLPHPPAKRTAPETLRLNTPANRSWPREPGCRFPPALGGEESGGGSRAVTCPSPRTCPGSARNAAPPRGEEKGERRGRTAPLRSAPHPSTEAAARADPSPPRERPAGALCPPVPAAPPRGVRAAERCGGGPTCGCGMAELALSPAAVLGFLRERGGWASNAELVGAFRPLLEAGGDAPERAERRERFKEAVNAVAVVKERQGTKFVVLRRHLRPGPPPEQRGDGGSEPPSEGRLSPPPPEELPSPRAVSELRGIFQAGGGGVPLPAGGANARREPLPKPCMLPVRCVPTPAAPNSATARGPFEEPETTPSPLPEEEDGGCHSPSLRRAPKNHRASEELTEVPLEEAEHRWLLMVAEGQWSQQLHGLLLGDASLAARRDFISGFTALHWAAKNGNCDMVRNIIDVAEKEGAHVNVDARSHGGYTALHLAAMHGRDTVISMLVHSYHAKIDLRDYSGKKPHQYLKDGTSVAVRRLLGDPTIQHSTGHTVPIKKSTKIAASILSSTSTFLGVISDDMAFYDLTKGLRKPSSLNKLLTATTGPRRKPKTRGGFPSYCSLSEVVEEEEHEEAVVKRRPVSELFFGH